MRMQDFIKRNRAEIDKVINSDLYRWDGNGGKGTIPDPPPQRDDNDRHEWILSHEGLQFMVRNQGVKV